MRTKTLAAKLALLVGAALSSAFLVTALVTGWFDATQQARLERERLTQTARVIASLSADAVARRDRSQAFAGVRAIAQMPSMSYARLETLDGTVLAETGGGARLMSDVSLEGEQDVSLWRTLTTGSMEAATPVLWEGQAVGRLVLFGETPQLRSRVLGAILPSLIGALIAAVLGLLVALRMARGVSGPIAALAARLRATRRSQEYAPVEDIVAEGEVGDLVAGVNDMMHGIRARDAEIAEHVRTLEEKVEARTAELADATRAAEAANAAKSDFLAVMSHEIRTPLNGILALGDLLARAELPARERRYAEVIAGSGRSLLNVINDILDFSKVEAGKMELEATAFDPVDLLEGVAELFAARAAEKDLDLAVYIDPSIGEMIGDPSRVRQVLSNLLNNAIKFTDDGGVLLSLRRDEEGVRFEVRDTGPGVPQAVLPTLFDAFTQADQSTTRLHGGTGLGLAICDRLVAAMGGRWDVTSTVGKGSTFAFVAPLKIADAQPPLHLEGARIALGDVGVMSRLVMETYVADFGGLAVALADAPGGVVGEGDPRRSTDVRVSMRGEAGDPAEMVRPLRRASLVQVFAALKVGRLPSFDRAAVQTGEGRRYPDVRVLVVDDSAVNREVARETLERLGAEVHEAGDGFEALDRLSRDSFDLVLMDGSMPGMDGFEASSRLRSLEGATGRPRVLVYALTAHVIGSAADAWRAAGMDGVVYKPFTLPDLAGVLDRHFAKRGVASGAEAGSARTRGDEAPHDLFDPAVRRELMAMGADGPDSFVARVEALYRENAPRCLADLIAAHKSDAFDEVARAANALKSMSLSLGATAVAARAGEMEHDARSGRLIAQSLSNLQDVLAATLTAMGGTCSASPVLGPEAALSDAIQAGRLGLVYQPLFDPRGQFAGKVEALTRWRTEEGGWRAPDVFIAELEAVSAIARLTDFVLARALEDVRAWPDVVVSINAGAAEFQAPDFANRVNAALAASGVSARQLEIEVTETAVLSLQPTQRALAALEQIGVAVALDDFGAGYTSLHALRDLPFRTLKIDKGFVDDCCADPRSAAIIHAVTSVGRALGMKVVCEGVETAEQAEFLRIAGAHLLQGYHFARPGPAEAVNALRAAAGVKDVA